MIFIRQINDRHQQRQQQQKLKLTKKMKKALRETQTNCALALIRRSQNFSLRRRPPSRGRRTAKI